MKLLIVKTSSLGDLIHMLPALSDAQQALPGLQVDWLAEAPFADIPTWHPAVQQVIPIAMRRWRRAWRSRQTWQELAAARAQLQAQRYDAVVDSQGLLKSALWSLQAHGPRIGYDRASAREPLAAWCYQRHCAVPRDQHAIARNRQLLAQALGYALPATGPDYGLQGLSKRLPSLEIALPHRFVLGLHGTSRDDKLWPTEGWVALAQSLQAQGRQLLLPWGNEAEHARAQTIAQHSAAVQVLPRLGLNALAQVIAAAEAVVGVDTGLLHLAAALGRPGLALYTATPPALTGAVSDRRAQAPLRNLSTPAELQATQVVQAVHALLSQV